MKHAHVTMPSISFDNSLNLFDAFCLGSILMPGFKHELIYLDDLNFCTSHFEYPLNISCLITPTFQRNTHG